MGFFDRLFKKKEAEPGSAERMKTALEVDKAGSKSPEMVTSKPADDGELPKLDPIWDEPKSTGHISAPPDFDPESASEEDIASLRESASGHHLRTNAQQEEVIARLNAQRQTGVSSLSLLQRVQLKTGQKNSPPLPPPNAGPPIIQEYVVHSDRDTSNKKAK